MTTRPWMPLYIADYLADTQHLNHAEHGVYLLLLMHHWQHGSIPVEDEIIARIARYDLHANAEAKLVWTQIWRMVRPFFESCLLNGKKVLIQKRSVKELTKASDISRKRRAAALAKASSKCTANAEQMQNFAGDLHTHARATPQPHLDKERKKERTHVLQTANAQQMQTPPHGGGSFDSTKLAKKKLSEDWPPDYRTVFAQCFPPGTALMPGLDELEKVRQRGEVSWATMLDAIARYRKTLPPDRHPMNPAKWLKQRRFHDQYDTHGAEPQRNGADRALELAREAEAAEATGPAQGAAETIGGNDTGGNDFERVSALHRP